MAGPSPEVMGGISAVVQYYLRSDLPRRTEFKYLVTHVDGTKIKKILTALIAYLSFIRLIAVFRPQIVHIHLSSYFSFYRKFILFLEAKLFRRKVLIHCHGSVFQRFHDAHRIHAFFIRKLMNGADMVLVLSKSWREVIRSYSTNPNVKLLYNPVDPSIFKAKRKSIDGRARVLFMGRIGKRKGIYDLLKVIPRVVSGFKDVKFILAGDGDLEQVREIVRDSEMENHVEIPGWVKGKDKIAVFQEAEMFILPSYNEGIPVSVLEAMAAALPVISTTIGGIPDAVDDGVTGFLIEPGDLTAMEEKILKLLGNPALRREMGALGLKKIQETFSVGRVVSRLLSLYEILER